MTHLLDHELPLTHLGQSLLSGYGWIEVSFTESIMIKWIILYYYWKRWFFTRFSCFTTDNQMFQYFITVVPTRLNTYKISADTHQFSVTERVSRAKLTPHNTLQASVDRETHPQATCFPGEGDKPRRGQSRRVWHLREVRYQLSDGDGQWAAHAAVAVLGAAVRHHRGDIFHNRWVWFPLQSYFVVVCLQVNGRLICSFMMTVSKKYKSWFILRFLLKACCTDSSASVLMLSAVASNSASIDPERWVSTSHPDVFIIVYLLHHWSWILNLF